MSRRLMELTQSLRMAADEPPRQKLRPNLETLSPERTTTAEEMPAAGVTNQHLANAATHIAQFNAAFARFQTAKANFSQVVRLHFEQVVMPLVKQKGEAWREWGALVSRSSMERDDKKRAALKQAAVDKKNEVDALEMQIRELSQTGEDEQEYEREMKEAEDELAALRQKLSAGRKGETR